MAQLAGFENILDATFASEHPEQGTMTAHIGNSSLHLEVPLTRIERSRPMRIGIRAGDILVASSQPVGLSARNIFQGRITSQKRQGVMVIAEADCGAQLEVHLTPGACASMKLQTGAIVWLVIKTYSCMVLQDSDQGRGDKD